VSKVTAETIQQQPVSNPLQALEGRVPGMTINQATGLPGGRIDVQIRGQNSIAGGNNPLYIIDGVPFTSTPLGSINSNLSIIGGSPLNNINPSDIDNITILKDADATAIYGSRGSNGVILITTKKGKAGKTSVDLNIYNGWGKVSRKMDVLDTKQYLEMRHEGATNDGVVLSLSNGDYDLFLWDTTRSTDWQKTLLGGKAHFADAQVSVSGGNNNTQFLLGAGYHRESTVFPGDFADKKGSVHFNIAHSSTNKKFRLNLSSSYIADDNNILYEDFTTTALILSPNAPELYDSSGKLNWAKSTWTNPFANLNTTFKATTNNLISNCVLNYELLPGLNIKTSLGYTKIEMDELTKTPASSFDPAFNITKGRAFVGNNSSKTWIIEPQIEYKSNLSGGIISALVGTTFQESINKGEVLFTGGYANDALLGNISAATSISVSSSNYVQYRYHAVFARFNYNWKEKYLLNLTGRRDGSSRFGPGNQFGNFGAIGAGWVFTQENFIQNSIHFISFGKLRASYGITGNDQIPDYGYLDIYVPTLFPYLGSIGLTPNNNRLFNRDYSWEVNRKLEAALEIELLNKRLFLSTSWYKNRTSNELVGYPLPLVTGSSSIQANLPAIVQNTGWEFELNSTNLKSKKFIWTSYLNLTIPRNKLVDYPNLMGSSYSNTLEIGKPLSIQKKVHWTGVDPQTGIYTFDTKNADGIPAVPDEFHSAKKVSKDFYGGFGNTLQYKEWSLDFFLQFVKQTGYNYLFTSGFFVPGQQGNQPASVMDRWRKPGDKTDIQKFTASYGSEFIKYIYNAFLSDNAIGDASFIRLKNVSLAYKIPTKIKQSLHILNCRAYIQGQNLFMITHYNGLDPETQSSQNLPTLRVVTIGIQLTF